MKYLVLEVHPAYAVVLDEEGRFLKAANLGYQVGSTVTEIVALRRTLSHAAGWQRPLVGLAALCACLCLVFFAYYRPNFLPYGSLRMQINPDVEMTISRTERVLALEGLNEDGRRLIDGYAFRGKFRSDAARDLVDLALNQGYLSPGETVAITVTSDDPDWQAAEEEAVRTQLEEAYGEAIVVVLGPSLDTDDVPADQQVVVPVRPTPEPVPQEDDDASDDRDDAWDDIGSDWEDSSDDDWEEEEDEDSNALVTPGDNWDDTSDDDWDEDDDRDEDDAWDGEDDDGYEAPGDAWDD